MLRILNAVFAILHVYIVIWFAAYRSKAHPAFYVAWFFVSLVTVFILMRNFYALSCRTRAKGYKDESKSSTGDGTFNTTRKM